MKVGQLGGVSIRLNNFFLVLLFFLALIGRLSETLILFGLVTVHEVAHGITAVSLGHRLREIELLPFGGVARLEGGFEFEPDSEWMIALAGPLTNLFLLVVGFGMRRYGAFPMQWWDLFVRGNLLLASFNLLPALPLDGGRILRAWLAPRIGLRRATERAAKAGRVVGVLLAAAGAVGMYLGHVNYTLLVLAFFIYFGASKELENIGYMFMHYLTRKRQELTAEGVIHSEQLVARQDRPVKDVVKHLAPKKFYVILVVDKEGKVQGLATEADVITALFDRGIETPVGETIQARLE